MAGMKLPDEAFKDRIKAVIEAFSGVDWTVYKKRPPDNTQMPYATIGSLIHLPFWNKSTWGSEGEVTVNNWSKLALDTQINDMNDKTVESLTENYPLTVAGFNCYRFRCSQFWTVRTEDESISTNRNQQAWHGIMRFSFRISSTERR